MQNKYSQLSLSQIEESEHEISNTTTMMNRESMILKREQMVDSLQEKVNILLEGGLVEVRIHAQEVNAGVKHQVMQAMMLEDMIKERERC